MGQQSRRVDLRIETKRSQPHTIERLNHFGILNKT